MTTDLIGNTNLYDLNILTEKEGKINFMTKQLLKDITLKVTVIGSLLAISYPFIIVFILYLMMGAK